MSADDDKALTWDSVGDPTHSDEPVVKAPKRAAAKAAPTVAASTAKEGPSSFLLISYGILGGMYLLYTVGWLVTVFNDNRKPFDDTVTEFMYQLGEYLAIASPALLFGTVLLLTRGRKPLVRLLLLVLGLFLVIPWPFVLLGA